MEWNIINSVYILCFITMTLERKAFSK
jgi:hypothetical protein